MSGQRDGVDIAVILSPAGDVLTGYPVRGPGVPHNPPDAGRVGAIARLQALVDAPVPGEDEELCVSLDELMAVGERPHVVASLLALADGLDDEQRKELNELGRLTGVEVEG